MDKLTELAVKYGTDKGGVGLHTYTNYYYELLKDKRDIVKKVLEIGIWKGASLFMWRDFFPNAIIYSIDIDKDMVKAMEGLDRIKVFQCDQTSEEELKNLIKEIGSDIELVVDDGSHIMEDQVSACRSLMPLLQKDVIYIIEDVMRTRSLSSFLPEYKIEVPILARNRRRRVDNRLVVVRK